MVKIYIWRYDRVIDTFDDDQALLVSTGETLEEARAKLLTAYELEASDKFVYKTFQKDMEKVINSDPMVMVQNDGFFIEEIMEQQKYDLLKVSDVKATPMDEVIEESLEPDGTLTFD